MVVSNKKFFLNARSVKNTNYKNKLYSVNTENQNMGNSSDWKSRLLNEKLNLTDFATEVLSNKKKFSPNSKFSKFIEYYNRHLARIKLRRRIIPKSKFLQRKSNIILKIKLKPGIRYRLPGNLYWRHSYLLQRIGINWWSRGWYRYEINKLGNTIRRKKNKKVKFSFKKITRKYNIFSVNILSTKTNHFCSITTLKKGHVLFLETPRLQGLRHRSRRWDTSLLSTLTKLFNRFFKKYRLQKSAFILQLSGKKAWLLRKIGKFLKKRLKWRIFLIRFKQLFPHNGCKLEIRKRKKRKGKARRKLWKFKRRLSRKFVKLTYTSGQLITNHSNLKNKQVFHQRRADYAFKRKARRVFSMKKQLEREEKRKISIKRSAGQVARVRDYTPKAVSAPDAVQNTKIKYLKQSQYKKFGYNKTPRPFYKSPTAHYGKKFEHKSIFTKPTAKNYNRSASKSKNATRGQSDDWSSNLNKTSYSKVKNHVKK